MWFDLGSDASLVVEVVTVRVVTAMASIRVPLAVPISIGVSRSAYSMNAFLQ